MPPRKKRPTPSGDPVDDPAAKRPKKPPDTRIPKAPIRIIQSKLDNILLDTGLKAGILKVCLEMHRLAILSYQFAALYLTKLLQQRSQLPIINDSWFIEVIRCVAYATDQTKTQRPKKFIPNPKATDKARLKKEAKDAAIVQSISGIVDFMSQHFKPIASKEKPIDIQNLDNQLKYLATEMNTALQNNIQEHYDDYLYALIKHIDPKLEKLGPHVKAIKHRLPLDLPPEHPLHQHLVNLTPLGELAGESVNYDIKVNPCRYLPCMFYMLEVLETPNTEGRTGKMFQLFPLRTDIIPKSVRIDTKCLMARLCLAKDKHLFKDLKVSDCQPGIWNHYFNTKAKCFGTGDVYVFDNAIITDGFSCSIQQRIREDHPRFRAAIKEKGKKKMDELEVSCPYVSNVNPEDYAGMQVVGIDPGVQDLLYCSKLKPFDPDLKGKKQVDAFRYSARQRAHEMKTKKFNRKRKAAIEAEPVIQGKTVEQWQHELSFEKRKTSKYDVLLKYVKKKNQVNKALLNFWSKDQFRLLKWKSKVNKRRSEDRMVNRFKKTFGPPETTLIAMGDWSRGKGLKFGGPTKGKSFRILFGRFGYKMVLVHEYRTSLMCHNCHCKTKNGQRKPEDVVERPARHQYTCPWDPRCNGCVAKDEEWAKNQDKEAAKTKQEQIEKKKRSIHGLLVCKTCNTFWNRDLNGSLNIGLVAREHLAGRGRPEYLKKKERVVELGPLTVTLDDLVSESQIGE